MDRRRFLGSALGAAVGALTIGALPPIPLLGEPKRSSRPDLDAGDPSAPLNMIQQMRRSAPTTPVKVTKLRDTLYLLQGVGGNMIVQTGPDGKLLIDSSVDTAAPRLKQALASLGPQPLQVLINTHWHFDQTDGNAAMHAAGALIIAHENTRLRLSMPQHIEALSLDFPAAATSALPQQVFQDGSHMFFNNDELRMVHFTPAHTDSDIYILFKKANVVHAGDLWCNGGYPLIDDSSGGHIDGMIRGCNELIELADSETKIVPGHGPVGDKTALVAYRDMLMTARDRVQTLKRSGRILKDAVDAKPTSDLDANWTKSSSAMTPDLFVQQIYKTLPESRA